VTVNSVVDPFRVFDARLDVDMSLARLGLRGRLGAASTSRSLQDEIAGRSFWHPNGFVKLVLEQHRHDGQLRLHVWPARWRRTSTGTPGAMRRWSSVAR
jgi:hypothetical protein